MQRNVLTQTQSVFGPHENVRHSVRKRAVSKEELHVQFTWWGLGRWRQKRFVVLVWCDRWCGEVARSSSSVCNKVKNDAGPEPSRMPWESRKNEKKHFFVQLIDLDDNLSQVLLFHLFYYLDCRLLGIQLGKSPTEHAPTETRTEESFSEVRPFSKNSIHVCSSWVLQGVMPTWQDRLHGRRLLMVFLARGNIAQRFTQ